MRGGPPTHAGGPPRARVWLAHTNGDGDDHGLQRWVHLLALSQGLSGQRAAQGRRATLPFDQGQPDCARPIDHEYDLGRNGLALDPLQHLGWRRAKHPRRRELRWPPCGGQLDDQPVAELEVHGSAVVIGSHGDRGGWGVEVVAGSVVRVWVPGWAQPASTTRARTTRSGGHRLPVWACGTGSGRPGRRVGMGVAFFVWQGANAVAWTLSPSGQFPARGAGVLRDSAIDGPLGRLGTAPAACSRHVECIIRGLASCLVSVGRGDARSGAPGREPRLNRRQRRSAAWGRRPHRPKSLGRGRLDGVPPGRPEVRAARAVVG